MRRRFTTLVMIAAVATVVYLIIAVAASGEVLFTGLRKLGWGGLGAVFGLALVNYGVRFVRWHVYLRAIGAVVPARSNLLYYLAGFALTVSPGKAGEAVRSYYLKNHGVAVPTSLGALFVERLLDLAAVVLLAALVFPAWPQYQSFILWVAVVLLVLMAGLLSGGFESVLVTLERRAPPRIAAASGHVRQLFADSARMLSWKRLAGGLLAGVVAWAALGLVVYLLASAYDLSISPGVACGVYAIAILASVATFFVPGGVGSFEAVMIALLVLLGASAGIAFGVALLCQLTTMWFAVLVGIGAVLILRARDGQLPVLPPS